MRRAGLRTIERVLAAVLLAAVPPVSVLAKPPSVRERAEQLNDQARARFQAGQYDEAADLFMQVYDLARTPTAVFNAARAKEKGGKLVEAKALYELYLRIEKDPAGLDDARKRIAEIEAALKAEADEKARKDAELKAKAEEDARKAREAAEAAAKKADEERKELERLRAEQAREEAERKNLAGLTILPPTGASSEETVRALQEVQAAVQGHAQIAQVGPVRGLADFVAAEGQRTVPGQCDFHCQLGVARSLGSAHAVTTALRQEGGQLRLRLVLWRTADALDAGQAEATAWTAQGLVQRARPAAAELFNTLRKIPVSPVVPLPEQPTRQSLQVETEPAGVFVAIDEVEVGQTPVTVQLAPGNHRMRLHKAGLHTLGGSLVMPAGQARVRLTLVPVPPPEPAPAPAPQPPSPQPLSPQPLSPQPQPAQPQPAQPLSPGQTPPVAQPPAQTSPPAQPAPQTQPPPSAGPGKGPPVAQPPLQPGKPPQAPAGSSPAAPPSAPGQPPPPPDASNAKDKRGLLWGLVGMVEGGMALQESAPDRQTRPDVNFGFGGMGYLSYGEPDTAPWVAMVLGARAFRYQSLTGASQGRDKAATAHGGSYSAGLALPRAGLIGTLHYNDAAVDNGLPDVAWTSWQFRIVSAKSALFLAFGIEGLIASDRNGTSIALLDELGYGPNLRLSFELGVQLGNAQLSK